MFRIITCDGHRYTVKNDSVDAVTFLGNNSYKSISGQYFLVAGKDIVNINYIIAIEEI